MEEHQEESVPDIFRQAVMSLADTHGRSDVTVTSIPAPNSVNEYSYALSADVTPTNADISAEWGIGRLVIMYDESQPEGWGGPWRIVCFAQAPLEAEIGSDPMLADVTWSWLIDALEAHGAQYQHPSGTATRIVSRGFGELAADTEGSQLEIRASWSPLNEKMSAHVDAWIDLVAQMAGMPPEADVPLMSAHRSN